MKKPVDSPSTTPVTAEFRVVGAQPYSLCRCGMHMELGSVTVLIGGLNICVGIGASGVRWPHSIQMSRETAAQIEPTIRGEWLRFVGAHWDSLSGKTR
jgi:hypothetical protein